MFLLLDMRALLCSTPARNKNLFFFVAFLYFFQSANNMKEKKIMVSLYGCVRMFEYISLSNKKEHNALAAVYRSACKGGGVGERKAKTA